jgi:hypothetical protein
VVDAGSSASKAEERQRMMLIETNGVDAVENSNAEGTGLGANSLWTEPTRRPRYPSTWKGLGWLAFAACFCVYVGIVELVVIRPQHFPARRCGELSFMEGLAVLRYGRGDQKYPFHLERLVGLCCGAYTPCQSS